MARGGNPSLNGSTTSPVALGRAVPGAPGTLPEPLTSFVGRERSLDEIDRLLGDTRVLTLTGAGGSGKTRLAIEAARRQGRESGGSVVWADFGAVHSPDLVVSTLLSAIGVSLNVDQDSVAAVVEQFGDRDVLLAIDNCEHLTDTIALVVAELARAAPRVRVLATSREPLGVEGETTYRVPSLTVPADASASMVEVEAAEATSLFLERARQARPDFRLREADAASVVEICRRLDGIPLAIELAAARARMLQPAEIANGLEQRFRLLTGGPRTSVPRQRTLEASVEWSHALLTESERQVLARLTVFAGSFGRDAAEAVCADDALSSPAVLDLLTSLVDRSLVQAEPERGRTRYRLHETIKAFARERMTTSDDPATLRDRHLDHFVGVASRSQLDSRDAVDAQLCELDADIENLRAAMEWAMASGRSAKVLEIVVPTYMYWSVRGHYVEMHRRLADALSGDGIDPPTRARALVSTSMLALMSGDYRAAHGYASAAVPIAVDVDDALGGEAHLCRAWSGYLGAMRGDAEIRADLDAALDRARAGEDDALLARALVYRGWIVASMESVRTGRRLLEEGLREIERRGVPFLDANAHAFLAQVAVYDDDLEGARRHARSALEISESIGYPAFLVLARAALALVDTAEGRPDEALRHVRAASDLAHREQLRGVLGGLYLAKLFAELSGGDLTAADATAEALRRSGDAVSSAFAEVCRGLISLEQGRHEDARRGLSEAIEHSRDPSVLGVAGLATAGLALTASMSNDVNRAWELAHDALEICAAHGLSPAVTFALDVVAVVASRTDRAELGARLRGAAASTPIKFALLPSLISEDVDANLRASLGAVDYERCRTEGAAMPRPDAIALARRRRGTRGRPTAGWDSLTPTELQVVELAAQGLTNAAIAGRLYVSPHTVKTHLAHVYDKLRVSGRAELAAAHARRH